MRTTEIALFVLITACALPAAAQDRCPWRAPGKPTRLFLHEDRVPIFHAYYPAEWANCVAADGGKRIEIEWLVGNDVVQTERETVRRSKDDEPRRIRTVLAPNHICDARRATSRSAKIATFGPPGEEETVALVPVRARIKATGALAAMAYTSPPVEVPCSLCQRSQGENIWIRRGTGTELSLEIQSGRDWFQCASRSATLALRIFTGDSRDAVTNAIAPDVQINGLEKAFVLKGDKYVLSKPLPVARLCAKNARTWAFELWGRGELMRVGGGGRLIRDAKCK